MHSTDPSEKIYECTEALILVGHVTVPKWRMFAFHSCYSYSRMYFFNTLKVSSNSDVLYLFSMRRTDYFSWWHIFGWTIPLRAWISFVCCLFLYNNKSNKRPKEASPVCLEENASEECFHLSSKCIRQNNWTFKCFCWNLLHRYSNAGV